MAGLIFGIADFAGDIGAKELTKEQFQVYHYPKMQTIVAARAAGIDCIDNVTLQFRDLDQCRKDAEYACKMGFDGKWAIHPDQVKIINEVFTPSKEELTRATDILELYKKADMDQGLGAIVYKDEMVDAATLRVEWKKVAVAKKAGLLVGSDARGRAREEAVEAATRAQDALGHAHQAAVRAGVAGRAARPPRRVPVHARHLSDHVPRQGVDDAAVRRLRHAGGDQRSASSTCSSRGRPACRWRSICRRSSGSTRTRPTPSARSARSAWPSTRSPTWRRSSRASRSTRSPRRSPSTARRRSCSPCTRRSRPSRAWPKSASPARSRTICSRSSARAAPGSSPSRPRCGWCVDAIQYCTEKLPRFNPISIASHFRDAGATPAEEAAYTLSDGVAYVKACLDRGHRRSTRSRRGCRSSSTPTSTSSRRSPSTARCGASGRA